MPVSTTPTQKAGGIVAFKVLVNGTEMAGALKQNLQSIEVEATYNRPDACTVSFAAPEVSLDKPLPAFKPGDALEMKVRRPEAETLLFSGEIVSIELEGRYGSTHYVIRGYDKRHRLYRGSKSATFLKARRSEIISKVLSEAGLQATVESSSDIVPYVAQAAESNGDFVERLLHDLGYVSVRSGTTIQCRPPGSFTTLAETLQFGANLETYSLRTTSDSWATSVEVRGWDAKTKKEIIGTASTAKSPLNESQGKNGQAFGPAKVHLVGNPGSQAEATTAAQAGLNRQLSGALQMDGTCDGNEKMMPGALVEVKGINATFNGKYRLSGVHHRWDAETGFVTDFSCNGAGERSIASLLAGATEGVALAAGPSAIIAGVVPAIVTDTKDDEDLGRIKVSFPWMPGEGSNQFTSHWVRLVMPGAGGSQKGFYLVPEVNDEVLVAFEHGDINHGYLLGGLYNSKDKPPVPNGVAVNTGKTPVKAFRSSKGHQLTFNDSDDKPAVELVTAAKKITMTLDDKSGDMTIKASNGQATITIANSGDITIKSGNSGVVIEAMKDISLKATGNIKLKATQNVDIEGMQVNIKAQTAANIEGQAAAALKGAKVDVTGTAMTTITGALVKIN